MESRLVVAKAWRKGEWGVRANGCDVYFGCDENVLKLDFSDGRSTL